MAKIRRLPERPRTAKAQEDREGLALIGLTVGVCAAVMIWSGSVMEPDSFVHRLMSAVGLAAGALLGTIIKNRMASEYAEKVRVWLNFWDDVKEDMDDLKHRIATETDEHKKMMAEYELEDLQRFFKKHYY